MLLRIFVLSLCVFSGNLFAAQASVPSVERLLEVTGVPESLSKSQESIEAVMRAAMKQRLDARKLAPAEYEKASQGMNAMFSKIFALSAEQSAWEKLKPLYVKAYQETYSQDEVDAALAFFGSSAGKAYLEKKPQVTQKSAELFKAKMTEMQPQLEQEIKKMIDELPGKPKS